MVSKNAPSEIEADLDRIGDEADAHRAQDKVRTQDILSPPPQPTTAERLVEYRDELLAVGFPPDEVTEMLRRAAAHPDGFTTKADKERQWQGFAYRMQFAWAWFPSQSKLDEPSADSDAPSQVAPEPQGVGPVRRVISKITGWLNV